MSLLGTGMFVFWGDCEPGAEADYDLWHAREHMVERIAVAGVVGGRRYIDNDRKTHRNFMLYELESTAVLDSAPYKASIQHASPWTISFRRPGGLRNSERFGCFVAVSAGGGYGGAVATALIRVPESLKQPWIKARENLPKLMDQQAITGVHFGVSDNSIPEAQQTGSLHSSGGGAKKPAADAGTPCVLILDGFDRKRLEAALPGVGKIVQSLFKLKKTPDWKCYDLSFALTQAEARKLVAFKKPK